MKKIFLSIITYRVLDTAESAGNSLSRAEANRQLRLLPMQQCM